MITYKYAPIINHQFAGEYPVLPFIQDCDRALGFYDDGDLNPWAVFECYDPDPIMVEKGMSMLHDYGFNSVEEALAHPNWFLAVYAVATVLAYGERASSD